MSANVPSDIPTDQAGGLAFLHQLGLPQKAPKLSLLILQSAGSVGEQNGSEGILSEANDGAEYLAGSAINGGLMQNFFVEAGVRQSNIQVLKLLSIPSRYFGAFSPMRGCAVDHGDNLLHRPRRHGKAVVLHTLLGEQDCPLVAHRRDQDSWDDAALPYSHQAELPFWPLNPLINALINYVAKQMSL